MSYKNRFRISIIISLVSGFILWFFSTNLFGTTEPWDADGLTYIIILVVISFISGLISGKRFWLWPLLVILGELIALVTFQVNHPSVGVNFLIPIGLISLLLFSLPSFVTSIVGVKLSKLLFKTEI